MSWAPSPAAQPAAGVVHVQGPEVDDVALIDERRVVPLAALDAVDGRAHLGRAAGGLVASVEPIGAGSAHQHVASAHAAEAVVASSAEQAVRATVAGQHIVAPAAHDVLDVALDVVALAGDAVVRAAAHGDADRPGALASFIRARRAIATRRGGDEVTGGDGLTVDELRLAIEVQIGVSNASS